MERVAKAELLCGVLAGIVGILASCYLFFTPLTCYAGQLSWSGGHDCHSLSQGANLNSTANYFVPRLAFYACLVWAAVAHSLQGTYTSLVVLRLATGVFGAVLVLSLIAMLVNGQAALILLTAPAWVLAAVSSLLAGHRVVQPVNAG